MSGKFNEGIATQIIRKFHGLEVRPEISKEVEDALDKALSKDSSRKEQADKKQKDAELDGEKA